MYKIPLGLTNARAVIRRFFSCIALCAMSVTAAGEAARETSLVEALEVVRSENNVAAFGLVIVQDDATALQVTRGIADRATDRAISDDAIFRVGSISKLLTGLLAAELEQRGLLDLDAPVSDWPVKDTYSNRWAESHPITTAQLLEHTAGFTDMSKAEWDYSDPRQRPLRETLRLHPEARVTRWPPGLHYSYTNAGAGIAGHVMELASGKSYETLASEILFTPLGLQATSVFPPPADRLPSGYDRDGVSQIPYWHQIFRPAAAINSTLADMSRLLRVLINEGEIDGDRVFDRAVIERTETPTTALAARHGLSHGYGLGNYSWFREGVMFRGHGGDADGYLSRLGYTRSRNAGYFLVITAFKPETLRKMGVAVEKYLLEGKAITDTPVESDQAVGELEILCGDYHRVTYRFGTNPDGDDAGMQVFMRSGALHYQTPGKNALRLIPVKEHLFRREAQTWPGIFIGPGDDGSIYFQSGSDNFRKLPTRASGEGSGCRPVG